MSDIHPACAICKGACCETLLMPMNPGAISPDTRKYLKMRGVLTRVGLRVDVPCKSLSPSGTCSVYSTRPDICRVYAVGGIACRESVLSRRDPKTAEQVFANFEGSSHVK